MIVRVLLFPFAAVVRLLVQTVVLALAQIWANKTRAMLTALGIIIGVSSVIAVIAGLSGMRGYVLSEFETFGARKMWVWGTVPSDLSRTMSWDDVRMTLQEAELILEHAPSIEMLTPMSRMGVDLSDGRETLTGVPLQGIRPEWHTIEARGLLHGRAFSRIDEEQRRQVCLINEQAIEELNLPADPVGEWLLVGSRRFAIVGVVETKEVGPMFGGGQSRAEVFVPYGTARTLNPYAWTFLMLQVRSPDVAKDAAAEVRFILRNHRRLGPEDPDTFGMDVLQSAIDQFQQVANVITLVAGAVVSISLLVGGIGIMNIMLVSVSERTREIGLRKAVGARPTTVLLQFLVEAVVLCLVGGMVGLALGQGMTGVMRRIPGAPLEHASVPVWAVALALGFSAGVGVVFGMFPAIKAARLNPIDALRHE